MNPLVCEMCNSNDVVKQDGVFVCQHCGTKYSVEEARKMMVEGTVKIDNSERLNNLYHLARRAKAEDNEINASKYYEMILIEDPTSWEASFYSVYFSAMQTNIVGIASAAYKIANSVPTALLLIQQYVKDREKICDAVASVTLSVTHAASLLFRGALNHYKEFSNTTGANSEKVDRVNAIIKMLFTTGDAIENLFTDDYELCKATACECWKLGFTCYESCNMPFPSGGTERLERIRKYEPTYRHSKQTSANSSSGCYIATSVYGSYDCPEVWTLRRFRDTVLAATWYGRSFIRFYYAISPILVKCFGDKKWFKMMWRRRLDNMVKTMQTQGIESTPYQDVNW